MKTINKLNSILWFLFVLLNLFTTFSSTSKEITVVTEYLAPYQIKNNDGSLGGFSVEVIKALFKITGDTPLIQVLPWARAYTTAKNQKNTLIFSIAKTDSRLDKFQWVGDLLHEQYYFWALATNPHLKGLSLEQLKRYRVATSRHSNENEFLIAHNFNSIYPVTSETQRTRMLYIDRTDLIIETELTLKENTKKLKLDFTKLAKLNFVDDLETTLSIAFNLNSDKTLVARYQQAFKQLKQSGQLLQLQQKWQIPVHHLK